MGFSLVDVDIPSRGLSIADITWLTPQNVVPDLHTKVNRWSLWVHRCVFKHCLNAVLTKQNPGPNLCILSKNIVIIYAVL